MDRAVQDVQTADVGRRAESGGTLHAGVCTHPGVGLQIVKGPSIQPRLAVAAGCQISAKVSSVSHACWIAGPLVMCRLTHGWAHTLARLHTRFNAAFIHGLQYFFALNGDISMQFLYISF